MIIRKMTFAITLLQVFFSYRCFGNDDTCRTYFTKPIEVVCNYPYDDITKWAITCRVWGLLKYFHPNVTAGKFDWDQVLIDRLPMISKAQTPEHVNTELMRMIRTAGEYKISIDATWNDSLNMNVNLCWLDHSFVNDSIRQALKEIASLPVTQTSYYANPCDMESYSYISITNEKKYDKELILHVEYRLLSLFRYWNVIYYFFPYKYLMDQSWDTTLLEFIPRFMTLTDMPAYNQNVRQLVLRLNDGHATSIPSMTIYDILKFNYITTIDSLMVIKTSPEGSLLERGDIILSFNGRDIRSIRDSMASLIPSSNKNFTNNAVNGWMYWSIINGCELTVMRNYQEIAINENKKTLPNDSKYSPLFRKLLQDIAYVNLEVPKESEIPDLMDSIKNCRGIIFDLRNYPKNMGDNWNYMRYISPTQEICYALSTLVDLSHPGAFYKYYCISKCPDDLWPGSYTYKGKIVVLVNSATVSAAESLAMEFRLHGSTLIGTTTAGANGNIVPFSLPGNINTYYSGIGFYYPDGTQMQRTGIIPDIEVYPTMDDILAGRDEILEAAIKFINSE